MAGSYPELDKTFKNTSTVFGFRHYETNVNESFCEKKIVLAMELQRHQRPRFLFNVVAKRIQNFPENNY